MSLDGLVEKLGLMLIEGVQDKAVLKAVFLAGSSGSGKSTVAKKLFGLSGMGLTASGLRLLSSDELYMRALEKKGVSLKDAGKSKHQPLRWAQINKIDKIINLTGKQRQGVIFDNTGNNYEWYAKVRSRLEKQGYDTMMVFVDVPLETALERNKARDRVVPDNVVKSTWSKVNANKKKYESLFGNNFIEIDNQDGSGVNKEAMRAVNKFVNRPVQNPKGKKWMKAEMEKLGIERLGSKGTPFGLEGVGAGLEFDHKAGNPPAIQKLVKPPKKVKPKKPEKDPVEEYVAGVKAIPLKDMLKLVGSPSGATAKEDVELILLKYATDEASLPKLKEEGFRNTLFGNFMVSEMVLADAIENALEEQGKKLWPDVDGAKVSKHVLIVLETGLSSPLPDSFAINGSMSLGFTVLYAPKGLNYDPPPWFETALLMGLDKATDEFGVTIDILESKVKPAVTGKNAFTYTIDLKLQFPNSAKLAAAYLDQKPEIAEMVDKIISDRVEDLGGSASPSPADSSLIKPTGLPDGDDSGLPVFAGLAVPPIPLPSMGYWASYVEAVNEMRKGLKGEISKLPASKKEDLKNSLIGKLIAEGPLLLAVEAALKTDAVKDSVIKAMLGPNSSALAGAKVGFNVDVNTPLLGTIGGSYSFDVMLDLNVDPSQLSHADYVAIAGSDDVMRGLFYHIAGIVGAKPAPKRSNVYLNKGFRADFRVDVGNIDDLGYQYSGSGAFENFSLLDVLDAKVFNPSVPVLTEEAVSKLFPSFIVPQALDKSLVATLETEALKFAKNLAATNDDGTTETDKEVQGLELVNSLFGFLFCQQMLAPMLGEYLKGHMRAIVAAAFGVQPSLYGSTVDVNSLSVSILELSSAVASKGIEGIAPKSSEMSVNFEVWETAQAAQGKGFATAEGQEKVITDNFKVIFEHMLAGLEGTWNGLKKQSTTPTGVLRKGDISLNYASFKKDFLFEAGTFEYLGSLFSLNSDKKALMDEVTDILKGKKPAPAPSVPVVDSELPPEFMLPKSSLALFNHLKKGDVIEAGWDAGDGLNASKKMKRFVVGGRSTKKPNAWGDGYRNLKITPVGKEERPMSSSVRLRHYKDVIQFISRYETNRGRAVFSLVSKAAKGKKKGYKVVSQDETKAFNKMKDTLSGIGKGTVLHILYDKFGTKDTFKLRVIGIRGSKYVLGRMGPSSAPNLSLIVDEAGKSVALGLDDTPYVFNVKKIKVLNLT